MWSAALATSVDHQARLAERRALGEERRLQREQVALAQVQAEAQQAKEQALVEGCVPCRLSFGRGVRGARWRL
jgi:hypothetical protein